MTKCRAAIRSEILNESRQAKPPFLCRPEDIGCVSRMRSMELNEISLRVLRGNDSFDLTARLHEPYHPN